MNEFEIDYKMGNSPKNTLEVIFVHGLIHAP